MTLPLSDETFAYFAAQHYNNPSCTGLKEFEDDLKRFKYIKRLLRRYRKTGVLSEKLILNHLILLHNVFHQAVVPMLFFRIEPEFWPEIKTFLVFLNYLPDNYPITSSVSETHIALNTEVINILRKV